MKYFLLILSVFISLACSARTLDKIAKPTKIMVSAGPDVSICKGDSVMMNGFGGQMYSWTPATGLSSVGIPAPWAKPLVTTTYILYSINGTGTILGADTVVVTVNPKPTLNLGVDPTFCEGQTYQMNPSFTGGITNFSWLPIDSLSNPAIGNPIANPIDTITYTLTVTTALGCSAVDTITLNVKETTSYIMGDTTMCLNDTLHLRAGGAVSYNWSPATNLNAQGMANPIVFPAIAANTVYTVTMMDSVGCNLTKTVNVTYLTPPTAYAGRDTAIYCKDSLQLFGSGGVSYQWNPYEYFTPNNAATTWLHPWYSQDYTLQVTDVNGCRAWDVVHVHLIDHFLNVEISPTDTVICPGDILELTALTTHPVVFYGWDPLAANLGSPYSVSTTVSPPNTMLVGVMVKDSLECKDYDKTMVFVDDFTIKTIENADVCVGQSVFLQTNGSNTFQYNWQPATGLSSNIVPSPHLVANNSITYTVECIDSFGCKTSDVVTLTSHATPLVYAGADKVICVGQTIQLNGATEETNIEWKPSTYLSNAFILNPIATPLVSTLYNFVATTSWGCKDSDNVHIAVFPKPIINISGGDVTICEGDVIQLTATGASNYEWSPAEGLSSGGIANPLAFPTQTTTYQIVGGTVVGCTDTATTTITVNPTPHPVITAPDGICKNDPQEITVTGGNVFNWNTGQTGSSIIANPSVSQWYTCTSIDLFTGCGGITDSVWVEAWDFPTAAFTIENPNPTWSNPYFTGMEIAFTNQSLGAETYTWNFGEDLLQDYSENPVHAYTHAGDFVVMLSAYNYHGCKDVEQKNIHLEYNNIHLPSAFTPNEGTDGNNTKYYIGTWGIKSATTTIYDRSGATVFTSEDKDFQWDGTSKGKALGEGVYVIKVDAIGENGEKYRKVGTITLIR